MSYNNSYYIFGGQAYADSLNDMWSYQPQTREWKMIQYANTPPPGRYGHCNTVYGNYIFVVGATDKDGTINSIANNLGIWMFNLLTNTWTKTSFTSEMQERRFGGCALYGSDLIVSLGLVPRGTTRYLNDIQRLNLQSIVANPSQVVTWQARELSNIHTPRSGIIMAVYQTFLIWFGGQSSSAYCTYTYYNINKLVNEYVM